MAKVNESGKIPSRGRLSGNGGHGRAENLSMGGDSLQVRDGAFDMSWFWQKVQQLRLALAAIEAKFGLLPKPEPATPPQVPQLPQGLRTVQSPAAQAAPPEPATLAIKDGFRNVYEAPLHAVEDEKHTVLSSMRLQIANRRQNEDMAARRLSSSDYLAYVTVRDLVETDAESRLALQNLVLSGKLNGQPAADGKSAWHHLSQMAKGPLGAGVDRENLVAHTLEELDNPVKIYQGDHNSCAAAVAAIILARKQPAEYLRLIGGLAAQAGTVTLAGGKAIARRQDWSAQDGGRSIGQAMLQSSLTQFGVYEGGGLEYDNRTDRISDGGTGLSYAEANIVYKGVFANDHEALEFYDDRSGVENAIKRIAQATAAGDQVPAGVSWSGGRNHKILIDKVDTFRVYYTNPYGSREWMTTGEFKNRLTNVNLPL
jgi:hypothetical protein